MTAELTGKMPAECIEIISLSFRHKHAAFSAPLYVPLIQLIYTAELSFYKAKNLKDTVNYKNDWKIHICILSSINDESLINLTVTYLKEKVQEFWVNNYIFIKIWDKYIE